MVRSTPPGVSTDTILESSKSTNKYSQDKSERIAVLQRLIEIEICAIDIDLEKIEKSLHDAKNGLENVVRTQPNTVMNS